jgi:putative membrane protein
MKKHFLQLCPRMRELGCAVALLATAASVDAAPGARPVAARRLINGFAVAALAVDGLNENERAFLTRAVEAMHNQMRLAEVGAGQADSSEVRSRALTMAADYRSLNDSLEGLMRRKGTLAGAPVGGTSERFQKLAEKAGSDFDREFIRTAAQLTSAVMTLFETAAADARDPDVRDFAATQLPTLRAHRNMIAELKKDRD